MGCAQPAAVTTDGHSSHMLLGLKVVESILLNVNLIDQRRKCIFTLEIRSISWM